MGSKITVVGLGYVGFPLAYELSREFEVIGFDIKSEKIEKYKQGINITDFDNKISYEGRRITFTDNISECKESDVYIIAVPTPIDNNMRPLMSYLYDASWYVGSVLNKGDLVIYESTVYPTATEKECVPILEQVSGLKSIEEFKYGYSPERVSPGIEEHEISKIIKIIAGCDEQTTQKMNDIYNRVIKSGTFAVKNIRTAEAVKITENVQRDVNIALMNELSLLYAELDINIYDVIEGSSTKWNFCKFYPGMVGGHCISVDPYYLLHQSKEHRMNLDIVKSSRNVNENYFRNFTNKIIEQLLVMRQGQKRVLLLGAAYKENINDFRNTKVVEMYNELVKFGVDVTIVDDYVDSTEFYNEFNIELKHSSDAVGYDLVFIYQGHDLYKKLEVKDFEKMLMCKDSIIYDYKNVLNDEIKEKFNVL